MRLTNPFALLPGSIIAKYIANGAVTLEKLAAGVLNWANVEDIPTFTLGDNVGYPDEGIPSANLANGTYVPVAGGTFTGNVTLNNPSGVTELLVQGGAGPAAVLYQDAYTALGLELGNGGTGILRAASNGDLTIVESVTIGNGSGIDNPLQVGGTFNDVKATGCTYLTNGLIMQWGPCTSGTQVTFPHPFPNAAFGVNLDASEETGESAHSTSYDGLTTTGFMPYFGGGSVTMFYTALGN